MARVLICGGHRDERERLGFACFDRLYADGRLGDKSDMVGIQGCARGWDSFGRMWFVRKGLIMGESLLDFPIYQRDWTKYKTGAGPRRNAEMFREGKPEIVVAGPGRNGTANMLEIVRKANQFGADVKIIELAKEGWFDQYVLRYT